MKYLVVGSGGREHAIYWRLLNDGSATQVYVAPGNGGIPDNDRVNIEAGDFDAIAKFCKDKNIDTVIVGPEAPLVSGIVDFLQSKNIPAFGPSGKAAMLEGSKIFAKEIMEKYNVPTAKYKELTGRIDLIAYIETIKDYPIVIKLDGLAAGKGVGIPNNKKEALEFIDSMVKDDSRVFVEEFIDGEEASVLGISDGETIIPLVAAQDHKRIFDGDKGPNTGGMGAYAPAPIADSEILGKVYSQVLKPTVDGMKKEGIPFKGVLYAGIIIKDKNIKVLEFNARFGDPETQVILPLINGKLGDIIQSAIKGNLKDRRITFAQKCAVSVVMASAGYPGDYEKGKEITGLDKLNNNVIAFHAGTKYQNGKHYTDGGRVLNVTAIDDDFKKARDLVYSEIKKINFDGAQYRKDIGHRALKYYK